MTAKWSIAVLSLLQFALASAPSPAVAVQPALIPAGKALDYRVIDSDTGAELWRDKTWQSAEHAAPSQWSRAIFPNGDWTLSQCIQDNGSGHPATRRLAVTVNASGQAVESDFDTFDPAYYPFLHRPLPAQPMESAACFTAKGLDYAALQRGEETSLYMWLDEAIFFRLTFRIMGKESVSVPAGTFDALKVRVKVDMPTFFPNLPAWAANLLGVLVPDFYAWVVASDRGDFQMVQQTGFATPKHKHTMRELVGSSELPQLAPSELELLHAASGVPAQPKGVVDNTGTFTAGDLRGRVVMSSAREAAGDLLVVRTQLSDGLAIEAHSLVNPASPSRTSLTGTAYREQRTYAPDGSLVQRRHLEFRADAFPMGLEKDLPDDLYAGSFTLAEVFPGLRPQADETIHLHLLSFDGRVNELAMWRASDDANPVDGVDALHLKLKPIVDLPLFLEPLKYFLIPTLDAYLQDAPPYRLLEFTGPLGPPGSAPVHFVADASLQAPSPPQLQALPSDAQAPGR